MEHYYMQHRLVCRQDFSGLSMLMSPDLLREYGIIQPVSQFNRIHSGSASIPMTRITGYREIHF